MTAHKSHKIKNFGTFNLFFIKDITIVIICYNFLKVSLVDINVGWTKKQHSNKR